MQPQLLNVVAVRVMILCKVVSTDRLKGLAIVVEGLLVNDSVNPDVPRTPTVRWCLIPTRVLLKVALALGCLSVV